MREKTLHTVSGTGIGTHSDPNPERSFDPQQYELALTDLQEFIAALNQAVPDDITDIDQSERPGHELSDTNNTITIAEDTALETIYDILPEGWDASVLLDTMRDDGYAVHAGVYCGGGADVQLTVMIQSGIISSLDFKYTDMSNASETGYVEVTNVHAPVAPRRMAEFMQMLSDAITAGYTAAFSSPVRALDYMMAASNPSRNTRPNRTREDEISQKTWSDVRGTTPQTISNNISAAREELDDPFGAKYPTGYHDRLPALEQVDPDGDVEADIRLV